MFASKQKNNFSIFSLITLFFFPLLLTLLVSCSPSTPKTQHPLYKLIRKNLSDNPILALNYASDLLQDQEATSYDKAATYLAQSSIQTAFEDYHLAIKSLVQAENLIQPQNSKRSKDLETLDYYYFYNAGRTYRKSGAISKAAYYLQLAINLKPDNLNCLNQLALLETKDKKYKQAINSFKSYYKKAQVAQQPSDAFIALTNLGYVHLQTKNYPKAKQYSLKALSLVDSAQSNVNSNVLANLYANLGLIENKANNTLESIRWLEKAKNLAMKISDMAVLREVYQVLPDLYTNNNQEELAINSLKKALELEQNYQAKQNDYQSAISLLQNKHIEKLSHNLNSLPFKIKRVIYSSPLLPLAAFLLLVFTVTSFHFFFRNKHHKKTFNTIKQVNYDLQKKLHLLEQAKSNESKRILSIIRLRNDDDAENIPTKSEINRLLDKLNNNLS